MFFMWAIRARHGVRGGAGGGGEATEEQGEGKSRGRGEEGEGERAGGEGGGAGGEGKEQGTGISYGIFCWNSFGFQIFSRCARAHWDKEREYLCFLWAGNKGN